MLFRSMPGFEPLQGQVTVGAAAEASRWELKMLSLESLQKPTPATGFPKTASPPVLQAEAPSEEAASRLLINGTVSNGASTPFALARAIGNNRAGQRSPYNGNISMNFNNAVLDARSFSLTGQNTPKPDYSRMQGGFTFGGPFRLPGRARNGTFTVNYGRMQNRNASIQTGLMPTAAQRRGDLSGGRTAIDPLTSLPFTNNQVPEARISAQARSLLALFPQPKIGRAHV